MGPLHTFIHRSLAWQRGNPRNQAGSAYPEAMPMPRRPPRYHTVLSEKIGRDYGALRRVAARRRAARLMAGNFVLARNPVLRFLPRRAFRRNTFVFGLER